MSKLNIRADDLLSMDDKEDGPDELVSLDPEALAAFPLTELYARVGDERGITPEDAAIFLLNRPSLVHVMGERKKNQGFDLTRAEMVKFIPGSRLGGGPRKPKLGCKVMVIGKVLGSEEVRAGKVMVGPTGEILGRISLGIEESGINLWNDVLAHAYGTNVVRFMPKDRGKKLKKGHIEDCMPLLVQEIAFMRPEYIIVLGMDAMKAVLGPKATMQRSRSRCFLVMEPKLLRKSIPVEDATSEQYARGIKVFVTIHPAAALREMALESGLEADLRTFLKMYLRGPSALSESAAGELNYCYVETANELIDVCLNVLAYWETNGLKKLISLDCEWGGGSFLKGKLRTIQFCWAERNACVVVLRKAGLEPAGSEEEIEKLLEVLKIFISDPGLKVIGHNIRADMLWLKQVGIDLSVVDLEAGVEGKVEADTMLISHALSENGEHGLDACAIRYTSMGKYDVGLYKWLERSHIDVKKDGFAKVPDELLLPYAASDADATFRIYTVLMEKLYKDKVDPFDADYGKLKLREMYAEREAEGRERFENRVSSLECLTEVTLPCIYPIHEIERVGILADYERMTSFVDVYARKKVELEMRLKEVIGNPSFNPRSVQQTVALFYGPRDPVMDGDKVTGWRSLGLIPFKTTEKPTRIWSELTDEEREEVSPSTDAESLEYLASEYASDERVKVIEAIQNFRTIDQVVKAFLSGANDEGEYESGLVGAVDDDGRIHTSLSQTSKTGRWKSRNPNMQNLSKKSVNDLEEILGDDKYAAHIRSCFLASPGNVLVEADYKSAEIYTLGYLANCPNLLKDANSDLHGRGAVNYFNASKWDGFEKRVPPPEEWLKENKHLRVAAKSVNFGIPYQRGAKAVAREIIKSTKGKIMADEHTAQGFIDGFYSTYPEVENYVRMCKTSVSFPRWLDNPFGRRRHFSWRADRVTIAEQEREAVNYPIQSTVAELLNKAVRSLWLAHAIYPDLQYKIVLAVHDAIILDVPGGEVPFVVDRLIPYCMSKDCVVPPWLPEVYRIALGLPMMNRPYYTSSTSSFSLDTDVDISVRWGEEPSGEELTSRGVPKGWLKEKGMLEDK